MKRLSWYSPVPRQFTVPITREWNWWYDELYKSTSKPPIKASIRVRCECELCSSWYLSACTTFLHKYGVSKYSGQSTLYTKCLSIHRPVVQLNHHVTIYFPFSPESGNRRNHRVLRSTPILIDKNVLLCNQPSRWRTDLSPSHVDLCIGYI